jgi:uncharacterized protein
MSKVMPQEIEVWYLIPALRREFAKIFIKNHGFTQRKVANILGITESAISQYINSKRGREIKFSKEETSRIKVSAEKIIKDPENLVKELYDLCISLRESKTICNLHKSHDKTISKDCNVCFN